MQYTQAGDVNVAYQVVGDGELDLVLVQGFVSHLDLLWENPHMVRFLEGLASFARVILFDKRGTGLSDRSVGVPTLEERMDDVRAVMDAAGSRQAVLMGVSEGAPMSLLFAATYPGRTRALVLHGGMARSTWAPDYPWAPPVEALVESSTELVQPILYTGEDIDIWAPELADDRPPRTGSPVTGAPASAPTASPTSTRCSSTSTCATCCRRSRCRRSCSIVKAIGS